MEGSAVDAMLGISGMLILTALGLVCIMVVWTHVLPLWHDLSYGPGRAVATDEKDLAMDPRLLIIVARDRPELFQQLSSQYGQDVQVILDRRAVPRGSARRSGEGGSNVCDAEIERDGFTMVLAK